MATRSVQQESNLCQGVLFTSMCTRIVSLSHCNATRNRVSHCGLRSRLGGLSSGGRETWRGQAVGRREGKQGKGRGASNRPGRGGGQEGWRRQSGNAGGVARLSTHSFLTTGLVGGVGTHLRSGPPRPPLGCLPPRRTCDVRQAVSHRRLVRPTHCRRHEIRTFPHTNMNR